MRKAELQQKKQHLKNGIFNEQDQKNK